MQEFSSEFTNLNVIAEEHDRISQKYAESLIASLEALFKGWEKGIGSMIKELQISEKHSEVNKMTKGRSQGAQSISQQLSILSQPYNLLKKKFYLQTADVYIRI